MATADERTALLAVTCPHCSAAVGELCTAPAATRPMDSQGGMRRSLGRPVTTLDGGCHDARWQTALGRPARVLSAVVAERHHPTTPRPAPKAVPVAVPVPVGVRPW